MSSTHEVAIGENIHANMLARTTNRTSLEDYAWDLFQKVSRTKEKTSHKTGLMNNYTIKTTIGAVTNVYGLRLFAFLLTFGLLQTIPHENFSKKTLFPVLNPYAVYPSTGGPTTTNLLVVWQTFQAAVTKAWMNWMLGRGMHLRNNYMGKLMKNTEVFDTQRLFDMKYGRVKYSPNEAFQREGPTRVTRFKTMQRVMTDEMHTPIINKTSLVRFHNRVAKKVSEGRHEQITVLENFLTGPFKERLYPEMTANPVNPDTIAEFHNLLPRGDLLQAMSFHTRLLEPSTKPDEQKWKWAQALIRHLIQNPNWSYNVSDYATAYWTCDAFFNAFFGGFVKLHTQTRELLQLEEAHVPVDLLPMFIALESLCTDLAVMCVLSFVSFSRRGRPQPKERTGALI